MNENINECELKHGNRAVGWEIEQTRPRNFLPEEGRERYKLRGIKDTPTEMNLTSKPAFRNVQSSCRVVLLFLVMQFRCYVAKTQSCSVCKPLACHDNCRI